MMKLTRQEELFLYGGGCQMEEENLNIQCSCGHECLANDVQESYFRTMCPDCYEEVLKIEKLLKKIVKETFTDNELKIIYDFGLLDELENGLLDRTISV